MNTKFKIGDVFEVVDGMQINVKIPGRFIYQNTPYSNELSNTHIKVGETLKVPGNRKDAESLAKDIVKRIKKGTSDFKGVKIDEVKLAEAITLPAKGKDSLETSAYKGEYVVTNIVADTDRSGRSPSGNQIFAKKLNRGNFSDAGKTINIYDSPGFYGYNKNVKILRTMKQKVNYESQG
jgi:hypothetical protein